MFEQDNQRRGGMLRGQEVRENLLAGRNPIREALKAGRDMEKILVARGEVTGSMRELLAMAKEKRIVVQEVDRTRLDAMYPQHQGIIALVSAQAYATLDDLFANAEQSGEDAFFVVLDGVDDPQNLGAIIRSCEVAGAHGVILPERRAVGLTPSAVRAAAGATEHLPVCRVTNIHRTLGELKKRGLWLYGAHMEGTPYTKTSLTGPIALVVGGEGEGLSRLSREACDGLLSIPVRGKITSLNASVAAGVLLYEIVRQRQEIAVDAGTHERV